MSHKYVITTGWWCGEKTELNKLRVEYGASEIRSVSFFDKWFAAIDKYTNPIKILVVDSASPTLPNLPEDKRIELLSVDENSGHSTSHKGKYAGVTRAHIAGMVYAISCEADYWVYVEQDALVYGNDIIEYAISSNSSKDFIFGNGDGTGQPMQQSLMIIKTAAIPDFLRRLTNIKSRDAIISPETKFAIASSRVLSFLPEFIFYQNDGSSFYHKVINKFRKYLFILFKGYTDLPYGYGRQRPINFDSKRFYFQHGSQEELDAYDEIDK
ncbi:hypothetical protein DI392_05470 [Vibrio albus]|uniref:Glycosyl transferase n=1 Tax=Vibrio albus TaxID=2200953 RepID=A0A2U3BCN7_9VIBR|nr:hypothetical protein [Vibrio albus]PWI34556.1 hypothetical protein DI392_05470 [Vibrio albus]